MVINQPRAARSPASGASGAAGGGANRAEAREPFSERRPRRSSDSKKLVLVYTPLLITILCDPVSGHLVLSAKYLDGHSTETC